MTAINLLALLALTGADPPAAAPERLTTPPLPPGVVCGRPFRDLGAVPLTTETTYAEVVAAWGEPRRNGPAHELFTIRLTCGAWLWLSFRPDGDRRLTRAILFTGAFVPTPRVIVDTLEITRRRRCGQVPSERLASGQQIFRAWGPPDNQEGSGIVRWTYAMANGGLAQVFPLGNDRFRVGCIHRRYVD